LTGWRCGRRKAIRRGEREKDRCAGWSRQEKSSKTPPEAPYQPLLKEAGAKRRRLSASKAPKLRPPPGRLAKFAAILLLHPRFLQYPLQRAKAARRSPKARSRNFLTRLRCPLLLFALMESLSVIHEHWILL
jgi:hypothetical protein